MNQLLNIGVINRQMRVKTQRKVTGDHYRNMNGRKNNMDLQTNIAQSCGTRVGSVMNNDKNGDLEKQPTSGREKICILGEIIRGAPRGCLKTSKKWYMNKPPTT
jgi:hypothetical protein